MSHQATLPFDHHVVKTFDQFIDHDAVVETMRKVNDLPQFVYVWGPVASGKSHLLQAFEANLNDTAQVSLSVDALYVADIDLVQVFPGGIKYLIIDDVDKLAGNCEGELALFNLFNHCKAHKIKLVLAAAIHSKATNWHLPDLVSRLNSGLSLKLETLTGQAAFSCIVNQFNNNGMPLDEAVIQYLQTHFSSDYADLYDLFIKASMESLKLKRKVTVPLLKQIIGSQDVAKATVRNTEI